MVLSIQETNGDPMKARALQFVLGIAVLYSGLTTHQLRADTLDFWTIRNAQLPLGTHANIYFLNGQFIAYGAPSPGLATSIDGTNWTAIPLPSGLGTNQVTFGN